MKNSILKKSIFYLFLIKSIFVFSNNTKINNYPVKDSLKVFSIELKKSISSQLNEIWNCENISYNFINESKKQLIIDIGIIPLPPIDMLGKYKLATNLILNRKIKINHGLKEGKLIYKIKTDKKIEHYEFSLFTVYESVPIAEDCDQFFTQDELKKCFKTYIVKHYDEKFNPQKFNDIGLEKKKHNVIIKFTINKNSTIEDVHIIHENEIIQKEFKEITQNLKIIEPGYKDGKPYNIKYAIPMHFFIE
ncbi:hypothetical protein [Algibacter luteus]|uniref:hypothetical protein n=1 Tax=Algibacter luteus TaxID=1178825 RepID=UPI0025994A5A|nr:hypothetical protein [Algibacter luteus]WJJ97647.1 hypothetical protein O5O44_04500 [Algibacter luteus]